MGKYLFWLDKFSGKSCIDSVVINNLAVKSKIGARTRLTNRCGNCHLFGAYDALGGFIWPGGRACNGGFPTQIRSMCVHQEHT